ncbi:MAG: 1,2-phenylacetyl-CoA epoxidase subunit B [Propionibacteriales bacterium]|nr:1,2-phenylacetyl-CoA epoxidase subunit B [Propionibacteriales bacterium]
MNSSAPDGSQPREFTAGGGHGAVPLAGVPTEQAPAQAARREWPLWEVFVRAKRGLSHVHVGSLHAPDADMAVRNARDLYTRRQEGVSIWVVPAVEITASSPDEKDAFFDPAADKVYRHPTFYHVPEGVEHL